MLPTKIECPGCGHIVDIIERKQKLKTLHWFGVDNWEMLEEEGHFLDDHENPIGETCELAYVDIVYQSVQAVIGFDQ